MQCTWNISNSVLFGRNVMMPPGPEVVRIGADGTLLAEAEDEAVEAGREAFALLLQEVAGLASEVRLAGWSSKAKSRGL